MKRILRILILAMAILLTVPVYAAPKGYKEVKITKKNAAKYFSFRKGKLKDEFGDYDGYRYYLYSNMRKKGYYVYSMPGVALKISYKYRYKIKTVVSVPQDGNEHIHTVYYAGGLYDQRLQLQLCQDLRCKVQEGKRKADSYRAEECDKD